MTFIAALRYNRIDAPFVFDQPINGVSFTAWVRIALLQQLLQSHVGDIPFNTFIDVPFYEYEIVAGHAQKLGANVPHLKQTVDAFGVICFGLIVNKAA